MLTCYILRKYQGMMWYKKKYWLLSKKKTMLALCWSHTGWQMCNILGKFHLYFLAYHFKQIWVFKSPDKNVLSTFLYCQASYSFSSTNPLVCVYNLSSNKLFKIETIPLWDFCLLQLDSRTPPGTVCVHLPRSSERQTLTWSCLLPSLHLHIPAKTFNQNGWRKKGFVLINLIV